MEILEESFFNNENNYLKTLKRKSNLKKKKFNKTVKIGISSNININFFDEILENFFLKKGINPSIKFGVHNNFCKTLTITKIKI